MESPDGDLRPDVLIVGAGVAGLCAAIHLEAAGLTCLLLDSSDDVGGRIRTDVVQGPGGSYRLDRGFQILLTAYPEAKALLDLPSLDLRAFIPGALTWTGSRFARLTDPRRGGNPLQTLFSGVLTPADALRTARLLLPILRGNPLDLLPPDAPTDHQPPSRTDPRRLTTRELLDQAGFSETMRRHFWNPFLAGVLLDRSLSAAAGFTLFTLRMFASGDAAVPGEGIGEIPRQLARKLRRSRIRLHTRAVSVDPGAVLLSTGERLSARAVLVATDGRGARQLLALPGSDAPAPVRETTTIYFAADHAPVDEPILLLDGESTGPVNHAVVPSLLGPGFAPPGKHLISLSTVCRTGGDVVAAARSQMTRWFGPQVAGWELLRTYTIREALPDASPSARPVWHEPPRLAQGLYRAGDSIASPSTQGAMASARRAASVIVRDLS